MNQLKLSIVIAPLGLLLVAAAYIYSLWAADRKHDAEMPFDSTASVMRDLLRFHEKRGGFPADLKQLEGPVWEKKPREFDAGNKALKHRNYYYLYARLDPHRFTLWAIPVGQLRDETPSWFLNVTPDSARRWKGPAIALAQVDEIRPNPSSERLGSLGMIEQPTTTIRQEGGWKER